MPDLHDSIDSGSVREIFIAESAGVEMHGLDVAILIEGVGIEGDRYADNKGHYSPNWHVDRQVTIIAQETIDAISDALRVLLTGQDLRRNIVTDNVDVRQLIGSYFSIGDALLFGGRENLPCRYLERLIDVPVFELLVGRAGVNCRILVGGEVRRGDRVKIIRSCDVPSEFLQSDDRG